jgi:hypothetical protein
MHVAIVIPCYNEYETLRQTCASLGFGEARSAADDAILVLMDNDSTDGTLDLATQIGRESPSGIVCIGQELERGFVPPRRSGNLLAQQVLQERGVAAESILVLQADADTVYSEGYVDAMRVAAIASPPGTLVQSIMQYPADFLQKHAGYIELCERAERGLEWLLDEDPEQVVVDDKAVGYRLSDYLKWGGHQREYLTGGDEIHAETTRLYMKGRVFGASLRLAEDASATHSVRRVLAEPAVDFATAGFPRETSWVRAWQKKSARIKTIHDLFLEENRAVVEIGAALRRRHITALFGALPLDVARTLGMQSRFDRDDRLSDFNPPVRSPDVLRASPGVLIEDAFRAYDLFF